MRNRKQIAFTTLSLFALAGAAVGATAAWNHNAPPEAAKIAPFVLKAMENGKDSIPVIVKLKKQGDLSSIEKSGLPRDARVQKVYDTLRTVAIDSQTDLVTLLEKSGVKYRRFYISNMVAVWGANAALITEIAARGDVSKVYGNPTFRVGLPKPTDPTSYFAPPADPTVGDNITYSKADKVWAKYGKAGEGITVAGQDTGVEYDHPALINQYRGNNKGVFSHDYNWHDSIHRDTPIGSNRCGYDLNQPCDDGDHGSHTVGSIIGAEGDKNIIGMAPKAQWIACRNMDGGAGTPASYIECFEWLLAPYAYGANPMIDANPAKAPHIINNSWGCPEEEGCSSDEIAPSLAAMKAAGILVVVSAGNEGMGGCGTIQNPPAWHTDLVLSVGAYDHRAKKIAYFSSRGPSKFDGKIGPDVVAPGVDIRSSVPGHKYAQYGWSGTSMAGPHVAGAAALLWSIQPELIGDIDRTKEILRNSATPTTSTQNCGGVAGTSVPNNTFGMGVFDIEKAIEMAGGIPAQNPTPAPEAPKSEKKSRSVWPSLSRAN